MTAPTVTSHRIDDTPQTPSAGTRPDDTIVLETADPRQVRKILGVVAAFLVVLVLFSASNDSTSVALGVNPTGVDSSLDRPLPRTDTTTPDAVQPVLIPVPTLVPVDRLVPIVIPGGSAASPTPPAARESLAARTSNGQASPEITNFFSETKQPTARKSTRFRFWAGDSDGHIRYLRVDFGDGHEDRQLLADRCVENPTDPVAERTPFSHVFDEPGTYLVTLTVASSGSCGNGPTQTVQSQLQVQVGLVDVQPSIGG